MKFARPALAIALGASLIIAGTADAKAKPKPPKPVCNLLTDATGDANVLGVGDPSNDAIDVVGGDIAADKKLITAVIRVKKLAKTSPMSPTGMLWSLDFTADDVVFSFAAHTDPTGAVAYQASYKTALQGSLYDGGATGTFDLAKSEIHVTAPVSLLAAQATIKVGTVLSALAAKGSMDIVVPDPSKKVAAGGTIEDVSLGLDSAASDKTYKVGTLSCVTPGK